MKIRKGDRVQVLTGKDRGKTGTVTRAYPAEGRVIVDNVNIAKKHQKPTDAMTPGGIIDKEMPIRVDNVAVDLQLLRRADPRSATASSPTAPRCAICRKCGGDL